MKMYKTNEIISLLLDKSKKNGATDTEVILSKSYGKSLEVRNNVKEKIEEFDTFNIGIRVFKGKKFSILSTNKIDEKSLIKLADKATEIAEVSPEDNFSGIATKNDMDQNPINKKVKILTNDGFEPSIDQLETRANEIENHALNFSNKLVSDGVQVAWTKSETYYSNSNDFHDKHLKSNNLNSLTLIASKSDKMVRDYDYSSKVFYNDIEEPKLIARRVAKKVLDKIGSTKAPTGKFPVIFEPRVAKSILSHIISGINGTSIINGTSFLKGKLNEHIFNKKINVARFSTLVNIGVTFLTLGKFKEGWEKYEYRWKVDPGDKVVWPLKGKSLWDGETKRRVLLWREQGIGDDIIFLGLVQEAYDAAGEGMSVVIDPRLVSICERSMPGIEFIPFSTQRINEDQFDCHLPMGSLPRFFRTSEEDFKRTKKSYLKADMEKVENLRRELGVERKSVIGISWKSFKSLNTSKKSMDLDQFGRIFKACNAVLLNLQYGDVDEEIREFKKNTGIEVLQCSSINLKEDLDGLAALIELCDLVVSTSSVTIHMAGALGKDSWVLLPFAANFWWLIERTDSLWYPTVRLYRQKSLQDWSEVLELITSDLNQRFDKQ